MRYVLIFFALVGVFFYKTIAQGLLPVPSDALVGLYHPWRDLYARQYPRGVPFKNFLITDPVRQQIPWRKIAIDQWKEGKIPWWNPYSFSGTPLAANIQAAVFYPLNFLFLLFDFPTTWTVLIVLQPLLSGLFFYVFARSKHFSEAVSLFGSIAWSFSGFMIAWMTWGTIGHVALWLPLLLLAIDKKNLWLFIFAFSMQFFAGHAQIALYVMLFALLYALYNRSFSKKLLLGLIISVVITSIQWIPFFELFRSAGRAVESGVTKSGWLMPWYHLVQFFAPDFFGNPATMNYRGEWNYGEFVGFIGVIPLLFAFYAMVVKIAKFWKIVAFSSLLLFVDNPLTKFFYSLGLPIFSTLQPTRLMVLVDFSLVMLALHGLDHWIKTKKLSYKPIIFLGSVYAVLWFVAFFGKSENLLVSRNNLILPTAMFFAGVVLFVVKNKQVALLGIFILTTFDLFRFGWKFTPFTPKEYFFPETQIISYLQSQPKPFRVMVVDERILPPNVSAYYGIEAISGYDPLIYKPYEDLFGGSGLSRMILEKNINSSVIPVLNVTYVLSLDELNSPLVEKIVEEGQTKLYKFSPGLPRVYFYPYDPNESQPNVVEYGEGRMVIEYYATQRKALMVSQINYPGWKAAIDDQTTQITHDDIFIKLDVPEGKHTVQITYER